jgi:hypothetical protein
MQRVGRTVMQASTKIGQAQFRIFNTNLLFFFGILNQFCRCGLFICMTRMIFFVFDFFCELANSLIKSRSYNEYYMTLVTSIQVVLN